MTAELIAWTGTGWGRSIMMDLVLFLGAACFVLFISISALATLLWMLTWPVTAMAWVVTQIQQRKAAR